MDLKKLPCFHRVTWQPTRKDLRMFSRAMLVGFALLGLAVAWRHHAFERPTFELWGAGAILAAAGLIPRVGRPAYLAVYLPTSVIGFVFSRVILTVVFYLIFTPLGLLLKLSGTDLLHARNTVGTGWLPHRQRTDRRSFYRQF